MMGEDFNPSIFETMSTVRSIELFRIDPEAALSGSGLSSAESDPSQDRSLAIVSLAAEQPERFMELLSHLPALVQDVFLQYYVLRRTQAQIAETLGINQSPDVWQALALGSEAICAIIAWGPDPKKMNGHPAAASYRKILTWKTKPDNQKPLKVRTPKNLGDFSITADDSNLSEFFIFKWHHGMVRN